MALFSYRAINEDGKEIQGSIDAVDLHAATRAIEDLHVEVVDVHEASRSKRTVPASADTKNNDARTFAFEGTDATGIAHRGTIQAPTKFDAFQKLKSDQKLTVKMLAPMGTLPTYNDSDVDLWQKDSVPPIVKPEPVPSRTIENVPSAPKPSLQFTPPVVPSPHKPIPTSTEPAHKEQSSVYHSIVSTLRLYAGWLLAWYGLFVAVGYYATSRSLPWDIPFVQAFYVSPLIFSFTVSIFLFLLLSQFHRILRGKLILGVLLSLLGIGLIVIVRSTI